MIGRIGRGLLWALGALVLLLVVAYIAVQRPDLPWAKLDARYADTNSRFMDFGGGVRVHYRDQGPRGAPVLLLVHGFSANLDAWTPWTERLDRRWRVVRLDLPGHGLTRAPATYKATMPGYADLADALARRLGATPYVIAGNSMGGNVAWVDALRHPDDVRGLVLVDAGGWPERRQPSGEPLIFKVLANPIGRALIRNIDIRPLAKEGLEKAYVDPRLVTPALIDRYVDLARAPGHRDILFAIQDQTGSAADFARIRAPTLVMHGRADALIPFADGEGFARAIPGAKLVAYAGVGHVPMEQIPDRSAADLEAFLTSLPPPHR